MSSVASTLDLYTLLDSCCSYKLGESGPAFYSGCLGIHICSVEAALSLHFVKVSLLVLAGLRTGSRGSQKDLW